MDRKQPIQVYGQGSESQGSGPHLQSIAGRGSAHAGVPPSQRGNFDDQSTWGQQTRLQRSEKLWELMGEYIGHDKTSIQK